MKIQNIRTITGPNVYSHQPVLVMKLDLQDLAGKESYEMPGFIDRLLALLPGVHEHYCGLGRPGGFVERLHGGTYFGHIVEHVALELTDPVGISTNRGKTVSAGEPGCYLFAVTYKAERAMKFLLQVAVELVQSLIDDKPYPLEEKLKEARRLVAKYELGPSTKAIVTAAERRGIPWTRADEDSLVRLGMGKYSEYIRGTISHRTSTIAVDIAGDKELTKQLLGKGALPVPRGCVVDTREEAIACLGTLRSPVVVKPLDGNQGRGVSLNLTTDEEIGEAFDVACQISRDVIVEEMFRGFDYRVVLVNGKMVAAAQRIPAHVWGDGVHTIRELIDLINQDPRRGDGHEKPLTRISADPIVLAILKRNKRTLEDVPTEGEMIILRESANLSTGGSARDVTDHVHPSMRQLCERAAQRIGLDVCGIDLVVPDVTKPFDGEGGIVEVNASPGIRMHHFPNEGQPRDVGAAIVDMLYPAGAPSKIPVLSITGTNGKTTVTRMIRHILASTGQTIGMTTTDGIWVGENEIARGDMTGPWSAGVVLSDPTVDAAVLETARGGIVRSGLGYDWSDISVMTNIQADHIGQDGIESIDDIVRIKRLVAERVREGGTLILNADDEHLVHLPEHERVAAVPKQIVYFSLDGSNSVINSHIAAGGTAYVAAGDWIEERRADSTARIARITSIPATLDGTAEFQIYNVLASVAACRAHGMSREQIADALSEFRMEREGAGRVNIYGLHGGYVVVDYGHNPAALRAMCRMISQWQASSTTAVLAVPGDRSDALIEDSARAAMCGFDRVIVREDRDLRGRRPGEVAEILSRIIEQEIPERPVEVIPDELEAVAAAVSGMEPNEVVVAFCDRVEEVTDWLLQQGAQPVTEFQRLTGLDEAAVLPAA
jgi:cyanophycin synthetase